MSKYCQNINLKLNPLADGITIDDLPNNFWTMLSLDYLSYDLKKLFVNLNLSLKIAGLFVQKGYVETTIHIDGPNISDVAKINWSFGNNVHSMNWYNIKHGVAGNISNRKSPDEKIKSREYVSISKDQVELIHSQAVGHPSIVQAGIPHNIINYSGNRKCLAIVLFDNNGIPLTMEQAVNLFNVSY